jgi:hypothetical protein
MHAKCAISHVDLFHALDFSHPRLLTISDSAVPSFLIFMYTRDVAASKSGTKHVVP